MYSIPQIGDTRQEMLQALIINQAAYIVLSLKIAIQILLMIIYMINDIYVYELYVVENTLDHRY